MKKLFVAMVIGALSLTAALAPKLAAANHRLCRIYSHGKLSLKAPATSAQALEILDQVAVRRGLDPSAPRKRSKSLYIANDNISPEKWATLSEHIADLREDLEMDRDFRLGSNGAKGKYQGVKVTINLLQGKEAINDYNKSYLKMAKLLKQYISPTDNRGKAIRVSERLARVGLASAGLWLWFRDQDLTAFIGEMMFGTQDSEVLLESSQYVGYGIGLMTLAALYPLAKRLVGSMRKLAPGGQAFALPPAKVFEKKVLTSEDILVESHSERSDNVHWIGQSTHSALDRISYRNEDGTPVMLIISRMTVAQPQQD